MRCLMLALLLGGCLGSAEEVMQEPEPQPAQPVPPQPDQTGLVLKLEYPKRDEILLRVSGTTAAGRMLGPFETTPAQVQPGQTIGLILNESDAGMSMICVEARDDENDVESSGCGMFVIRAREIVKDELKMIRPPGG